MKSFFTFSKLRALCVLAVPFLLTLPTKAVLDVNVNGMSDLWEKQHNSGDLFPNTFLGTNDPDQDGWTNATEAVAGTDPYLANPPDGIIATTIAPTTTFGAFTLTWPTIAGKNYRLQASSNLINWLNVGNTIIGTTTSHTLGISAVQPDTTVPPKLFWRIVASDLDTDTDGLTNAEEVRLGLDPANAMNIPGIPDLWLATHFFNELLTVGLSAVVANPDADGDGRTIQQENADGTDPNKADTDEDGLNDSIDADPLDAIVNWQTTGRPNFAVIEIPVVNLEELQYVDHSQNGTILFRRTPINQQSSAVMIDKQQNVHELSEVWFHHLHDDLVPSWKSTATSDYSLYDPLTNTYQPWNLPVNHPDGISDVRNGLVLGNYWISQNPQDGLLRRSPQGDALPGQAAETNAQYSYIDKDANITSTNQYWAKQPDSSYTAKQFPATPNLVQASVSCATHTQIIAGVEKKWALVSRSGAPGLLISENGGGFNKATKRFGSKNLKAVTRQGWIFDDQFNVWTGQQWQTLLEILGSDYTQAELLGINDEGLAVAKITKSGQPMKIGLLVPVEIVPDAGMIGVIGDVVKSVLPGSTVKHFVTPKKSAELAQEYVELKAAGVNAQTFSQLFEWEGGIAGSSAEKRKVNRDEAGKTEIKIKVKQGGAIAAKMNVWCVWATMTARFEDGTGFSPNNDLLMASFDMSNLGKSYKKDKDDAEDKFVFDVDGVKIIHRGEAFTTGIEWKSAISPTSMFQITEEAPDLTQLIPKEPETLLKYDNGRAYYTHWDIPRYRKKVMLFDGAIITQEQDWVIDDDTNYTRDEDPYEQASGTASAEIYSIDGPGCQPYKKFKLGQYIGEVPNTTSFTVNHVFQEWTRVRIADKWYNISEKYDWWSNVKINKVNGIWTSDIQKIGTGIEEK